MRTKSVGALIRIAAIVIAQGWALGAAAVKAEEPLCDTGWVPAHDAPVSCGGLGFISSDNNSGDCTVFNMAQSASQLSTGEFYYCTAQGSGSTQTPRGYRNPLATNSQGLATGCILITANDNSLTYWGRFNSVRMLCRIAGPAVPSDPGPQPPPGPTPA